MKLTFKYLSNIGESRVFDKNKTWITMKLANHNFYFYFKTESIFLVSNSHKERVLLNIPFTSEALSKVITAFIGEPF